MSIDKFEENTWSTEDRETLRIEVAKIYNKYQTSKKTLKELQRLMYDPKVGVIVNSFILNPTSIDPTNQENLDLVNSIFFDLGMDANKINYNSITEEYYITTSEHDYRYIISTKVCTKRGPVEVRRVPLTSKVDRLYSKFKFINTIFYPIEEAKVELEWETKGNVETAIIPRDIVDARLVYYRVVRRFDNLDLES